MLGNPMSENILNCYRSGLSQNVIDVFHNLQISELSLSFIESKTSKIERNSKHW